MWKLFKRGQVAAGENWLAYQVLTKFRTDRDGGSKRRGEKGHSWIGIIMIILLRGKICLEGVERCPSLLIEYMHLYSTPLLAIVAHSFNCLFMSGALLG